MLGITLLAFGASKLVDPIGFADTVVSYQVLPDPLARAYGFVLPWAEVLVGICLIIGFGLRFVAPMAMLIGASLIAGTVGNLYLAKIKVTSCGCFAGLDWTLGSSHIVAQVVMLTMATQIWLHKGEFLSLDSKLSKRG